MNAPLRWTVLTGEFPPGTGGVGDYTAQVAAALAAAGDRVTVFRPPSAAPPVSLEGVQVVTLPDHFGAAARGIIARHLDDGGSARVLVQYVPQAFGIRGANVTFCRWLHGRSRSGDDVRVMFHEPYLYLSLNPAHAALAVFQRAMASFLLRASKRVYVSTTSWLPYLRPYAPGGFAPIALPIPSNIPALEKPACVAALRSRMSYTRATPVIGHFGTYGDHIAPLLSGALLELLQADGSLRALCIGGRSDQFVRALIQRAPAVSDRVNATGWLSADEVALHLQCCDVLLQPYPDGVTTRRTSVMAALANGRAVVTTDGELTESVWREAKPASLVPAGDVRALVPGVRRLLHDDCCRASLAARAASIYQAHFALERTITVLRNGGGPQS